MASSTVINNICAKLDGSFTVFLGVLTSAYTSVNSSINLIKTTISGMQFSAINALNQAAADVDTGLDNAIPDIGNEFDDILNMINSCAFLRTDKTLGNPLTLIRTLETSMRSDSQSVFNALTSGLAEFNVARLMDSLFVRYGEEFKFGEVIPSMYQIIDCIDTLCPGTDISSEITIFETYLNKLYLLFNGSFDKVRFFDELGLNAEQVSKINISLTSYSNMRSRISGSISNGVDFAKSLI